MQGRYVFVLKCGLVEVKDVGFGVMFVGMWEVGDKWVTDLGGRNS
jgi:hypothetical protein